MSVFSRFLFGSVLSPVCLALCIALVLAGGRDRAEAPMVVFFASLIAVPAVMLLNCWVLFVGWRRLRHLIAAALVLPAVITAGALLVVYGTGPYRNAGMVVLLPFLAVPMRGLSLLTAAWAVGIAGLLFAAWRVAARSES